MFNNNVSTHFKISYFISSFLLCYIFLLIIMYVQYVEGSGRFFPNFEMMLTTKKVAFLVLGLLSIISFLSLFYVKKKIKESIEYLRSNGRNGSVGYSYNNGSREFILGVLLPVVTTISVPDTPVTGIVSVLLIQFILGYFYWHSNELFVNVPLMMVGYSLVVGKENNQGILLFIENSQLKALLGKDIKFVHLGKVEESNLGVVGKENING